MRRLALLALLTGAPVFAQTGPAISVEALKPVDRELSSAAGEGRAPTTPAGTRTLAYIVERFRATGLKPGGPVS